MEYFRSFTQSELANLIKETKKELYLCLPSIHEEISGAITYLNNSDSYDPDRVKICIVIDYEPQTFRQGYGDHKEVEYLLSLGFDIKCLKKNRISFIISDEVGYYLFVESRSLIPADKPTTNAIRIDPVSIVRLKHFFFSHAGHGDFEDELTNAIIEESKLLDNASILLSEHKSDITIISDQDINDVNENLKNNPPIHPDFKRTVEFYSNKFQYAELHFEGQNMKSIKVNIPPNILPYNSVELKNKLITKLQVFENIEENQSYLLFEEIVRMKKSISRKYLSPLRCKKNHSILLIERKGDFNAEVNLLHEKLDAIRKEIYGALLAEINLSKQKLSKTLYDFLLSNPTDDMKFFGASNYPGMAKSISDALVNNLNFPDIAVLLKNLKVETQFSDITYEDLRNEELLDELREKGMIDEADVHQITTFGSANEVASDKNKIKSSQ